MIQRQLDFDAPRARLTDPATSHEAAAKVRETLSRRCAECLEIVRANPGITGAEVEKLNVQARKRLLDLERAKLIVRGEVRDGSVSWRCVSQSP